MKILEIDYYNNLHLYLLYKRNDNIYFYLIFHFIIFYIVNFNKNLFENDTLYAKIVYSRWNWS